MFSWSSEPRPRPQWPICTPSFIAASLEGVAWPDEHQLRHHACGGDLQQVANGLGDVLWSDHLLARNVLLDEVGHWGVDERGAERGRLDALRAELLVHRFRPADNAVLGGGVDRGPGLSELAGDRGGVDNERVPVLAAGGV